MTDQPRIHFPTDYPIKVIGLNQPEFKQTILAIIEQYDPNFRRQSVTLTPSKNARYVSLTVVLWATGEDQIRRLFESLKTCPWVKLVL